MNTTDNHYDPKTINQSGAQSIYVGNNTGTIRVYSNPLTNNYETLVNAIRSSSYLRHYEPAIKPEVRRPEQDTIIKWVGLKSDSRNPKRICFIYGDPGIGKTALTNSIYTELSNRNEYLVWGMKADRINIDDISGLSRTIGLTCSLTDAVREATLHNHRVVIIVD